MSTPTPTPPARTPDHEVAVVAGEQHGVFSRDQAIASGFTRKQMVGRLAAGVWVPVHPRVYRHAATPVTRSLSASAAHLYAGDESWFSHASAARLLGIDPLAPLDPVHLTVPAHVQRPERPGIRLTRSRRIDGFTTVAHGRPVLTPERTMVDLAAILDLPDYQRVMYDAVGRGIVTVEGVLTAAEDFGGKAGLAQVRVATHDMEAAFESSLEAEADAVLREAGIVLDRQVEVWEEGILIARFDFADEAAKFAVEVDGSRYHSSRTALRYDRERDRLLRRRGWWIERFTTKDVRYRQAFMQRAVRAAYDAHLARMHES